MPSTSCQDPSCLTATLVFLVQRKKVWLAKKLAKIGEMRLNGPGGKMESQDSTPEGCAKRETWEELRVNVDESDLEKYAVGYFTNVKSDGSEFLCIVHIFIARKWRGIPKQSKEMSSPRLVNVYNLPYKEMMAADRYWLPKIFRGEKIVIRAKLKNGQSQLVGDVQIEPLE